jgi:7-cyano-7-deazaguanine synthase
VATFQAVQTDGLSNWPLTRNSQFAIRIEWCSCKVGTVAETIAVLFSAGLDSAVLLADAARRDVAAVQPIYVSTGLAWEEQELAAATRLLDSGAFGSRILRLLRLSLDMRDVYPPDHWAVRGKAPAFDTPDEDVYIEGRNVVLLSKAAVYMARAGLTRVLIGPLAGNPFPDATPAFFTAIADALSIGLAAPIAIDAPFAALRKADVVALGRSLRVPLELTLSCMQPRAGVHCGRCSKCRERRDGFREAGVEDPTKYVG